MTVKVEPSDFQACPSCGDQVLSVSYLDFNLADQQRVLVDPKFQYDFKRRDFHGVLVVEEKDEAMAGLHGKNCRGSGEEGEDKDRGWRP